MRTMTQGDSAVCVSSGPLSVLQGKFGEQWAQVPRGLQREHLHISSCHSLQGSRGWNSQTSSSPHPLLISTHGNFCSKMETTNDAVAETVWNTRITTFPNSSTQIIHSRQLLLRFSLLQQWLPKKKAEPKAAGIVINLQTAPAFLRESEHCFRVYLSSGNAWIQASLSRDLPAQAEEVDNPSWRNGCVAHLLPCSCGIALSWP